jgi:hypothetical protein
MKRWRTLYLVVGSFFAMANINDAEQRLVDTEALSERSKLLRMSQESNLLQLHGKLIETKIDLNHNRPAARVAV